MFYFFKKFILEFYPFFLYLFIKKTWRTHLHSWLIPILHHQNPSTNLDLVGRNEQSRRHQDVFERPYFSGRVGKVTATGRRCWPGFAELLTKRRTRRTPNACQRQPLRSAAHYANSRTGMFICFVSARHQLLKLPDRRLSRRNAALSRFQRESRISNGLLRFHAIFSADLIRQARLPTVI